MFFRDDRYSHDSGYSRHDDYGRGPSRSYGSRDGGSSGPSLGSASSGSHADDSVQPPMMSFKAYLTTQDDTITDEEAIKKYAEYKLEFKRQQLNEFFVNHKDEEW